MKIQKQLTPTGEQGIAHLGLMIVVLAVLAIIGFAGYTVYNRSGAGKKASTATTTTTADSEAKAKTTSCEATYHDANLCKFSANADVEKLGFKGELTSTDTDGKVVSMTVLSDGKGNTSITGALNMVALDNVTYIETDGVWYEYPAGDNSAKDSDPASNLNLVLGTGLTYTPEGKEACGSRTCFKYALADSSQPSVAQTVWFDTSDYLLRQWKYIDPSTGTVDMSLSYQSVKISKPSPVQSYSSTYQ
ncbi:MAG TPA: hypothetical protein VLF40_03265 [Candidatus Saccharimonadales bacterium]|nr:hypothetical protein [Candidatus Saccharimonadales bacterium]